MSNEVIVKKPNEVYRKVYIENGTPKDPGQYMTSHGNLDLDENGWSYSGVSRPNRINGGPDWWLEKLGEEI